LIFKIKTPHPNPLPTSGERGLEGVFLLLQEKIYESFYFNLKIFKFYISTFLLKKLSSSSPLPACRERVRVRGKIISRHKKMAQNFDLKSQINQKSFA
jgi:hypothetical protein